MPKALNNLAHAFTVAAALSGGGEQMHRQEQQQNTVQEQQEELLQRYIALLESDSFREREMATMWLRRNIDIGRLQSILDSMREGPDGRRPISETTQRIEELIETEQSSHIRKNITTGTMYGSREPFATSKATIKSALQHIADQTGNRYVNTSRIPTEVFEGKLDDGTSFHNKNYWGTVNSTLTSSDIPLYTKTEDGALHVYDEVPHADSTTVPLKTRYNGALKEQLFIKHSATQQIVLEVYIEPKYEIVEIEFINARATFQNGEKAPLHEYNLDTVKENGPPRIKLDTTNSLNGHYRDISICMEYRIKVVQTGADDMSDLTIYETESEFTGLDLLKK